MNKLLACCDQAELFPTSKSLVDSETNEDALKALSSSWKREGMRYFYKMKQKQLCTFWTLTVQGQTHPNLFGDLVVSIRLVL